MHAGVLLDRTGSMQPIWDEALKSVNEYVSKLKASGDVDHVTVAVFDAEDGIKFDVVRDVAIGAWTALTNQDAFPRGMTPLNDAVVRFAALLEAKNDDKTVAIVMTDGQENASRETTREGAKVALDRLRARNWQVVFLNVNFDGFAQSAGYGAAVGQTMSAAPGNIQAAMRSNLVRSSAYNRGSGWAEYTAQDRKEAGEEKVTGRKTE